MLHRITHRLSQVAAHFTAPGQVDVPESLAHLLTPRARERFQSLSASDQRHLIDVATNLSDAGASWHTITAGLLHDIGKAVPGTPLRLHHRVAKVLIETIHPDTLHNLRTKSTPPRGMAPVWVLVCHPRLGANLAATWGYPDRVVWLIANHEDTRSPDPDLQQLIAADAGRLKPERARMLPYG
jgi:HD-like signal output (HDOD) protein